jgi:hypothetical protein
MWILSGERIKMCEFLSWIEKPLKTKTKYYFLTYDQIYNTPRGEILRKQIGSNKPEDYYGHEAIRKYYELTFGSGKERECVDYSKPSNFPTIIAKAIKRGEFRGMATPEGLLSQPAWAEYEKIRQQALAEYKKIGQQAWAEYKKIRQQALAEYEKIEQPAWAEYEKIRQPAWAEYEKIRQQALAEYEKIEQPAWAEYKKIRQQVFWDLFTNPENRNPEWR